MPLLRSLEQNRTTLLLLYVLAFALYAGVLIFPKTVEAVIDWSYWWTPLKVLGGILASQVLFLYGGGRIRLGVGSVRHRRLFVSILIGALLLGFLTALTLTDFLEFSDSLREVRSPQGQNAPRDFGERALWGGRWMAHFIWVASGCVLFWYGLVTRVVRRETRDGALTRVIQILLAVSWVELVAAFSVHVGLRRMRGDGPAEIQLGTWISVWAGVSAGLWSAGPALVLLHLRRRLDVNERRVLRLGRGRRWGRGLLARQFRW